MGKMGLAFALKVHAMKHTPLTKNRVVSKDNENKEKALLNAIECERLEHGKDIMGIVKDKEKVDLILKKLAEYHLGEDEDYYEVEE